MAVQPACPKCQGFLVLHPMDDHSHVIMAARCVNCGTIVDPVITQFKRLQQQTQSVRFHYHPQQATRAQARSRGKYK